MEWTLFHASALMLLVGVADYGMPSRLATSRTSPTARPFSIVHSLH
jgi:hypothetical protein